ncbi:MAG: hypothetical protein ACTHL1_05560 [Burkholderiaceae bacterium]
MTSIILGVYPRYAEAQRVRYDLILSGHSSAEVDIATREELQSEYGIQYDLPERAFALLLHADAGARQTR